MLESRRQKCQHSKDEEIRSPENTSLSSVSRMWNVLKGFVLQRLEKCRHVWFPRSSLKRTSTEENP